jgi:predicted membrane protein
MGKFSNPRSSSDGGIVFGFIIIGVGVLILLRKLGFYFPDWVLSWPMILVGVGIVVLIKHQFQSFFGAMMLGFGLYFLAEREFGFDFGIERYVFPVGLILLGIYLVTQKQKEKRVIDNVQEQMRKKTFQSSTESKFSSENVEDAKVESETNYSKSSAGMGGVSGISYSDSVNIDAILSGVSKRILSKNFQGGKLTAFMGGVDLDLSQADLNGVVTVQVDVIFGGMKLVVPPHWDVRTEVTNIAAGIEDKRIYRQAEVDPDKVLVLKGTILFGGLEIKSF